MDTHAQPRPFLPDPLKKNPKNEIMHESSPTLPGMEPTAGASYGDAGELRSAVERTINALEMHGLIEPEHAAICQLALVTADVVQANARTRRPSAFAMVARELRETLMALPKREVQGNEDKFKQWVELLEKAANAGDADE